MPVLSSLVILVTTGILLLGKYRLLDSLSKIIMIALTVTTVSAVVIAFMRNGIHGVAAPDFVAPSPWELSKLAFLVALMGGCLHQLKFLLLTLCGWWQNVV